MLVCRRKLNFTTDMETNTSQPSERNAVGCFYGTLRKKLLMINTEKGKGKKSFTRDWYFHEGRRFIIGLTKQFIKS